MTRTKNTLAIAAALFVGGLMVNPASAATNWSDLSAVTHVGAEMGQTMVGRTNATNLSDLTAVTHGRSMVEAKQIGRFSADNYRASDITAITHN